MKIGVFTDLRFTTSNRQTGVGKHIDKMCNGLADSGNFDVSVLASKDQFSTYSKIPSESTLSTFAANRLPISWHAAEVLWTTTGGPACDKFCHDFDWVYCPKNDFIPLKKTKLAITIHGAYELDPDVPKNKGFKSEVNRMRRRLSYRRIVERADLLLTVSDFLKNKIIECFSADPEKIVVVGNGVEKVFSDMNHTSSERSVDHDKKPFLLCVGGLNTIDGGHELILTAKVLKDVAPDVQFLVAGWQHESELLKAANALPNIKLLGYVGAPQLAVLMRNAVALFYLTRYETFGIAAAEAMTVGTPVLTAGGTAVPEIVGDAGLYVSRDPEEIMAAILRLLSDHSLGRSLAERGKLRAVNYTWEKCIERLGSALESRF